MAAGKQLHLLIKQYVRSSLSQGPQLSRISTREYSSFEQRQPVIDSTFEKAFRPRGPFARGKAALKSIEMEDSIEEERSQNQTSDRSQTTQKNPRARSARHELAGNLVRKPRSNDGQSTAKEIELRALRQDMLRNMTRKWRSGDVYAPHDLTGYEMSKWRRKRSAPEIDVLKIIKIDPVKEYKNFALLAEFTTDTGRIRPSKQTGLSGRNQNKMAKAIRRSIGLGLLPSVHKHPELMDVRIQARQAAE